MAAYRVYFFNADEHIFATTVVEAETDAAVAAAAKDRCASKPACVAVEIWLRDRRIHRYEAEAA